MIYYPDEDSVFLLEVSLEIGARKFLDMGTGTGLIAIEYKTKYPESYVVGADISQEAIRYAESRAKDIGIQVKFILSDLFENINERFDLIVFNSPYLPDDGMEYDPTVIDRGVVRRFMEMAPNYLNPEGKALILTNNLTHIQTEGWKLYRSRRLFFEELRIYMYLKTGF
ncbi:MAG: methyltransferase [Candidatus Micrarchaeota archaeon]|nr:methyltransferase [Candidatus Micrarchaeota archaeon]